MDSVRKPPSTLMAMAARARDKRGGILKRGAGGSTPMEMGMDAQMNNGQGHGHNFFSTTPLMGQAMSGTQLGQADSTIRNAQSTLARFRFAEGGKVQKPAGPSAKERKEIRNLIEQGKDDAVTTLRAGRAALMDAEPKADMDFTASLDRLHQSLAAPVAMADGGEVDGAQNADPQMLYDEYTELLATLQDGTLDEETQIEANARLQEIEQQLDALGVDVAEDEST